MIPPPSRTFRPPEIEEFPDNNTLFHVCIFEGCSENFLYIATFIWLHIAAENWLPVDGSGYS